MSEKFLDSKLSEISLNDFSSIEDYLLLSNWLETQNIPLKVTKKNYFTQSQRLLTSMLAQKSQEDILSEAIKTISRKNLKATLNSISSLSVDNKAKEMRKILKAVLKLKSQALTAEGISDTEGKLIEGPLESQERIIKFFQTKYSDSGEKVKFQGIQAPNIAITIEEFERIIKRINRHKGNGYDYIPLSILNIAHGRSLIFTTLNELFRLEIPPGYSRQD